MRSRIDQIVITHKTQSDYATTMMMDEDTLTRHTNSILRKLSKRLDIPMDQLLNALFEKKRKTQKKQPTRLEYMNHEGSSYLYDPKTNNVFTYAIDKPEYVGTFNEQYELVMH